MADANSSSPIAFEARSAGEGSGSSPTADTARWGTRWEEKRGADGSTRWRERPLTWEDLLDPQEGDSMVHGTLHGQIICRVAEMLRHWFQTQGRDDVLVTDDVKIFWGIPGLANIGPDVAVIPNVRDSSRPRGSFRVTEEGTSPSLVIEVFSKSTRKYDQETKPGIYERAGVRESFSVDPLQEFWVLSGQRRGEPGGSYRRVELDADGWLVSETTGLRFRIGEDRASLEIEDCASGERLRDLSAEALARHAAELEAARQRTAREQAERRATKEAAAREQEAAAREQAEQQVASTVTKNQALEAELARLRRALESPGGRND